MPTGPTTAEIVSRSMRPEGVPPPLATRERLLAHRLRERYEAKKQEDPLAVLRLASERPPLEIDVRSELERRIDRQPDAHGNPTNPRYQEGERLANQAIAVSEGRWAEPGVLDLDVLVAEGFLARYPTLNSFPPDQQKEIIQNWLLTNPDYQRQVQTVLEQRLSANETVDDPRLREALTDLNTKSTALQQKEDNQAAATSHLNRAQTEGQLDLFIADPLDPTHADGNRLAILVGTEAADRARSTTLEGWINTLTPVRRTEIENNVMAARATGAPMAPDEARYDEHLKLKDKVAELDGLRTKKLQLQSRLGELDEIDGLQAEATVAGENYARIKEGVEQKVVRKLERVLRDAADPIIKGEFDKRIDMQREQESELAQKASTEYEQQMILLTTSQLERRNARGEYVGVNRVAVNRAWNRMMRENGPDEIIKGPGGLIEQIKAGLDPARFATPAEMAAERARIDQLFEDETFMTKARNNIFKGVMSRYMLSGGRISDHQIRVLRGTTWGIQAIEAGITENEALRDQINNLREKGAAGGGGGMGEWLRNVATNRQLLWILLGILGLGGVSLLTGLRH